MVLIGKETAGRKWIKYEIEKSWNDGKGLLGIYIHNLKDSSGNTTTQGANPFDDFTMKKDSSKLSSIVKVFNPPFTDSKQVYGHIQNNIEKWVEEAVKIRANYK